MNTNEKSSFGRRNRREIIRREEARSERFVAYYRIALGFCGGIILLLLKSQIPETSLLFGEVIALACMAYSGLVLLLLAVRGYSPSFKYVTIVLDVLAITALLAVFGEERTFKSPALVLYFLVIGLAGYKFSARLTAVAGILSVIGYSALVALGMLLGTVSFGTLHEAFRGQAVSLADAVVRGVFILAFTGVCIGISLGYGRIIRASALSEIRAEHQRREKLRMRHTLTRYMSAEVADVVMRRGGALDGENRNVTVLFCDIRGFTKMTGHMPPKEIVSLLNEVLGRLVDVVFSHGGTLDKYLGDGLMAVFGAPLSSGRDEEMAVLAAVRMREEMDAFNLDRIKAGLPGVQIGIGIHSGEVVAGSIGSLKRLEYTVIGSTVNLASRIEQLNKQFKTDILISEKTFERVRHFIDVDSEPATNVRGVEGEVHTYNIKRVHPHPETRVGEEFLRMGAMTEDQVRQVLDRQGVDRRFFGEIAVEMGFMNAEALSMYLATARSQRAR